MSNFHGAHDFNIEGDTNIYTKNYHHHDGNSKNALRELREHIATGAMHDSAERCDAPKCHPETRVAVQDELIGWIEHGDEEKEPKRIVWVTAPAGGGKTAIMGSTAETCQKKGLLACGFFFSAFAGSANRRTKKCLIPTLAYQFLQHDALRDVGERILSSIERDPVIFERQLKVQLEKLLLQPFREGGLERGRKWPKVIVIDGLDECEAEQYNEIVLSPQEAARAKEADQVEILQALLKAVNDPYFPFRIIVASRPEPVFQSFFSDIHCTTRKIFLDEKYNPDADMLLFLQAKFADIRRRYQLAASWPSEEIKRTLVQNASGQFVYVATVMRFIEGSSALPDKLLAQVLELRITNGSANPFAPLDALYTHILSSCPDPLLTVRWLLLIFPGLAAPISTDSSARFVQLFLESSPGEASHVFRGLNSLVHIPPNDHTSPYLLFHKSLTDFLEDPSRCESLYVHEPYKQYLIHYMQIWKDKGPVSPLNPIEMGNFLNQFFAIHVSVWSRFPSAMGKDFRSYDVAWWVRSQDECTKHPDCKRPVDHLNNVQSLFISIHSLCKWYRRCRPVCRYVRAEMLKELRNIGWKVPARLHLLRHRFLHPQIIWECGIDSPNIPPEARVLLWDPLD